MTKNTIIIITGLALLVALIASSSFVIYRLQTNSNSEIRTNRHQSMNEELNENNNSNTDVDNNATDSNTNIENNADSSASSTNDTVSDTQNDSSTIQPAVSKEDFYVEYYAGDGGVIELSAVLPTNAEITYETTSGTLGMTTISFGLSVLSLEIPHIGSPETYKTFTAISGGKIPNLYRVLDQSNRYYYVTDLSTATKCQTPEGSAIAPCATKSVMLSSDSPLVVRYEGVDSDFTTADEIMKSLELIR